MVPPAPEQEFGIGSARAWRITDPKLQLRCYSATRQHRINSFCMPKKSAFESGGSMATKAVSGDVARPQPAQGRLKARAERTDRWRRHASAYNEPNKAP